MIPVDATKEFALGAINSEVARKSLIYGGDSK